MRTKVFIMLSAAIFLFGSTLFSQGFTPPSKGKAAVYFVRATGYGFAVEFEYFDNDRYIGAFKGENYFRYECDPGHHLLWASSENKEFCEADLAEGGTYIIKVDVIIGGWQAHVGFTPVSYSDRDRFEMCRHLIMKKEPKEQSAREIDKMNNKLRGKIANILNDYNSKGDAKKFRVLKADMAIPQDALK